MALISMIWGFFKTGGKWIWAVIVGIAGIAAFILKWKFDSLRRQRDNAVEKAAVAKAEATSAEEKKDFVTTISDKKDEKRDELDKALENIDNEEEIPDPKDTYY